MNALASVLNTLRAARVTHVTGIPDNTSAPLFDALAAPGGEEDGPLPRLVRVTREGEAVALASGLWLGGARPLVVVQNTGLLEAGDALRGTAVRMGAAVPLLVTGRGYAKMRAAGLEPGVPRSPELLQRPDVDSVALLTEPTLDAWGVPWRRCDEGPDAAAALAAVIERTRTLETPVALILTASLT